MQAGIRVGVEVGELAADQKRLRRTRGLSGTEPQHASAWYRDGARPLIHIRQGKGTAGELLDEFQVVRLLVELSMRIAWHRAQPRTRPVRQWHLHEQHFSRVGPGGMRDGS